MKRVSVAAMIVILSAVLCFAQQSEKEGGKKPGGEAGGGRPPAPVAVSKISSGAIEPVNEFVGTVYYAHVSKVASEIRGKIDAAPYEEGKRVKDGQVLVKMSTDLIDTAIKESRASYEQSLAELEQAKKDFSRIKPLYENESISEAVYDEKRFHLQALEQKAASLQARLESMELERTKKSIKAPFAGIVISKPVERGEWVSEGGTVAVLADFSTVDVIVDVPEGVLDFLKQGQEVEVGSGGKTFRGTFLSFVPKGDIATRTFSVKIRMRNTGDLIEGMAARAKLPTGPKTEGLIVDRDAVIVKFGQNVVFLMEDGAAKMVPVEITGYSGLKAGIKGPGLNEGMTVIIKGHERLQDGQPVRVAGQEGK